MLCRVLAVVVLALCMLGIGDDLLISMTFASELENRLESSSEDSHNDYDDGQTNHNDAYTTVMQKSTKNEDQLKMLSFLKDKYRYQANLNNASNQLIIVMMSELAKNPSYNLKTKIGQLEMRLFLFRLNF
jgi:hypothetical protein